MNTNSQQVEQKSFYTPFVSDLIYSGTIPKLHYVDTGASVDKFYIFGKLPNNTYLVYAFGCLQIAKGMDKHNSPLFIKNIYWTKRTIFNSRSRKVNKADDYDHQLVEKARSLVKIARKNTSY